jgi:hypothetical protein
MAETVQRKLKTTRLSKLSAAVQGSQAWNSIFRPGSIFRKGYSDSPRNRSYVIMNSVLYHLHPVKVKRHAVKVSYTLCLGGLSFFLFILRGLCSHLPHAYRRAGPAGGVARPGDRGVDPDLLLAHRLRHASVRHEDRGPAEGRGRGPNRRRGPGMKGHRP